MLRTQTPPSSASPINVFRETGMVNPSDLICLGDSLIDIWKATQNNLTYVHGTDLSPASARAQALWPTFGLLATADDVTADESRKLAEKRHRGLFNIVFGDSHVENLKPQRLFDIRRDDVLKRWHRDNLPHRELLPQAQ